ncbi:ty1-copia retrotransposon protein [Cucumis melo var. makuwa]|uniref:Ty1-copia retrotransposon protein n=1 Tax=Cucumis melo var. makuwa TaxID=1194695 RepID=A0A5D3CUE4_CUCMM|nr:ty1-copia retrotransposon protein [Cucumis melo var. makuwa]TYK15155.1 ty1-copia retrotransposon protein [Cucumis melo var. makuwa]
MVPKISNFFEQLEVDFVLTTDPSFDPITIPTPTFDLESFSGPPTIVIDQMNQVSTVNPKKYTKTTRQFAGRKKYVVEKWLQFQITDDKPILEQIHEYENFVANFLSEGMKCVKYSIDRSKQVKRKNEKASQKKGQFKVVGGKVEKKKLICYVCGKEGHKSYQCYQRKGRTNQKPIPQSNLAEQDNDIIAAVVEDTTDEERIFMENFATEPGVWESVESVGS